MFFRDSRRERRSDRPRRRPDRISVEGLETRQLMTYSPLGYSLPNLSVSGYAAQEAAWGGTLGVEVVVQNQGASSLVEPTHLFPTTTDLDTGNVIVTQSTADAAPSVVDVYASTKPNATTGLVRVDTVSIPAVTQNSQFQTLSVFTLPSRPKGFPSNGGKIFLTFVLENSQAVTQKGQTPEFFRVPLPVKIVNPLPNLQVVGFDIPTTLQPGDVISPTIQIANLGAGNPSVQGPVTVDIVASLDKNFGPGDSIVGSYVISSLPGLSEVPTQTGFTGAPNLLPAANVNTTTLAPIKLPANPGSYFLGIEIDPTASIKMTHPPTPALMSVVQVGPRNAVLPPTTLLVNTNGIVPVFPARPSTVLRPTQSRPPPRLSTIASPTAKSRRPVGLISPPGLRPSFEADRACRGRSLDHSVEASLQSGLVGRPARLSSAVPDRLAPAHDPSFRQSARKRR